MDITDNERISPIKEAYLRYIILAVGVGVLALAGFTGYVVYPRFDLPPESGIGLLILAAGAGIASFFTPCSFPLLLTLLARETKAEGGDVGRLIRKALRFAGALSIGAFVFLVLTGGGIALGAGSLFEEVTFTSSIGIAIRVVIGTLLILLGFIQLEILPVSFDWVWRLVKPLMKTQAKLRRSQPTTAFVLFGFGYLLAGFG